MKRLLFLLSLCLCTAGAWAQDNYDFYETSSGQTLYYKINDDNVTVTVVHPETEDLSPWGENKPSGILTIPSSVTNTETGTLYSVTAIGQYVFYQCGNLTSVNIPNSVTTIGKCAFLRCSGFASVTIPNSVKTIGEGAFEYCTGLTNITIPNSVKTIDQGAFEHCTGLTGVTLGDSVTMIGGYAFKGCSKLESVNIPNSVTTISGEAFLNCSNLTSVTIPNSVTSLGAKAFQNCSKLDSVTIGNSLIVIQSNVFDGCSNLKSVTIGNSVTTIAQSAFQGCSSLTSVVIPNSVTRILPNAFKDCSNLESVVIGRSVGLIGPTNAFQNCTKLKTVYNLSNLNIVKGENTYGGVAQNAKFVVTSTNSGTGTNTICQIPDSYTFVDVEDDIETHIPRATIPNVDNLVYKDGGNWIAKNIVLTDGQDAFEAPVAFTADSVTYTREFTDGHRSTLYLPFTAANPGIEVYEFSGFDGNILYFQEPSNTDSIRAYTPYLVGYGLAPAKSTTKCVISQKNVKFLATADATPVTPTYGNMTFKGTLARTGDLSTNNYGYKDGFFVQSGGAAHVNPFRCYFTYSGDTPSQMPPHTLSVAFGDGPLAIDAVEAPATNGSIRYSNDVYDLMGRLVRKDAATLDGLPTGIYIWKGRKVLAK